MILNISFLYGTTIASDAKGEPYDVEREKAAVQAVLGRLDNALQSKDMELFSGVYAHGEDIIIVGPDVREMTIGWEPLAKAQTQQFEDVDYMSIASKDLKIEIDISGTLARYVRKIDVKFVTHNLPFSLKGVRETGILKKRDGEWVIVQQHSSAPVDDSIWPYYLSRHQTESSPFGGNKKFGIDELREDFDLLRVALEEAHPGMYRYTPKSEMDLLFRDLLNRIDREMTEIDFFRLVAPAVEKIHCVHTELSPSLHYQNSMNEKDLFFPFDLKFISGNAHVLRNFNPECRIPEGSEIVSIENEPMPQIIETLFTMLPSDGKNTTCKYRILDRHFPEKYFLCIGQPDSFTVEYRLSERNERASIAVPGVTLAAINSLRPSFGEFYSDCLNLRILDESQTAILTIKTFVPKIIANSGYDYYAFLASSFEELKERNVRNLIVDLRWNDGGESFYCIELLSYLIDKPFRFLKSVYAENVRYSFLEYTDKGIFFNYFHPDLWTRSNDGRYLLKGDWGRVIEPNEYNFNGSVYVLVNGMSISGSADVAALLHYHKRAVFIGEETGGAYRGNNSGDFILLTLPNTSLRIRIPIRGSDMAVSDHGFPERGVVPEHEVHAGIEDILQGIDRELEYALTLTSKGGTKNKNHPHR
jgi:ketosteroid isomerase-like protein